MIDAMTKKRLLLLAILPLAIAVMFGVLAMLPPSPGVTKANFDRIEDGMTAAEVERIFGRKADAIRLQDFPDDDPNEIRELPLHTWRKDDGICTEVGFTGDGVVWYTYWHDPNETIFAKLCRRLRLP